MRQLNQVLLGAPRLRGPFSHIDDLLKHDVGRSTCAVPTSTRSARDPTRAAPPAPRLTCLGLVPQPDLPHRPVLAKQVVQVVSPCLVVQVLSCVRHSVFESAFRWRERVQGRGRAQSTYLDKEDAVRVWWELDTGCRASERLREIGGGGQEGERDWTGQLSVYGGCKVESCLPSSTFDRGRCNCGSRR